jgi:SAM-dependent methyltransferase
VRASYYALKLGALVTWAWWHERRGPSYAAEQLRGLFAEREDPWSFASSELARERFACIWQLAPPGPFRNILEIGCAEGHFTLQIAERHSCPILALDFIATALERAARRCAAQPHVCFQQLDLGKEDVEGQYDLVFCMGVLEYGPRRDELPLIRDRIVKALAPGGYLVLESDRLPKDVEDRWWVKRIGWGARAQHDRFLEWPEMTLVRETPTFDGRRLASLLRRRDEVPKA